MKSVKLYILCLEKKRLVKKYIRILKTSILIQYKMDTIFMTLKKNFFYPHGLILNLSDKINLTSSDKYVGF